ncbi:glycoside hydrolase superfamily [Chaetomium fimeti]|uniref:chitinase n=1 Tax=Chaetomium fimeti TaxID=1854472 RepID=A0AAE0LPT1_9PEZI|nr:glycoside hydrolase superfamily [Chaetomium fimeti]
MLTKLAVLLFGGLLLLLVQPIFTQSTPDYTCSPTKPCTLGCWICGMGPTFCAAGNCTSECNAKSECDPGWGLEWSQATNCPLNVCCSKFGFCGTSADFCDGKTVSSPECPGGKSADERTIGYYEGWNLGRSCGLNPTTFHIEDMGPDTAALYDRVSALKSKDPDLKVWIAVGGWAMNDPGPYRTTFSDLAKSTAAQDAFFESLITFMRRHNFDGVDLDWEYPVADDRGGIPEDYDNFITLVRRLRERLNRTGRDYGITLTLPASYWYLRGFNLQDLEPWLDWFNVMTYDIHGTWDSTVKAIGPYAYAHTNMTEIQQALELLWRNNINPGRVVLGLGFYGRSFTMKSPDCMHSGCEFTDGARGGECTGTPGVLSAAEINAIIANGATVTTDEVAGVQIVTWDSNQWVSYDDAATLKTKLDYANLRCLGGTMVWAIDLDDGTLINALGSDLSRPKNELTKRPPSIPDFETEWDEL